MARNKNAYPKEFWEKLKGEHKEGASYNFLCEKYGVAKSSLSYNFSEESRMLKNDAVKRYREKIKALQGPMTEKPKKNIKYKNPIGPMIRARHTGYKSLATLKNKLQKKGRGRPKSTPNRMYRRPIGPKYKLMGKKYILSRIIVNEKNNCWEWIGTPTSAGYGQLRTNDKYWTSHRYSYTQFVGEIPEGLIIRHMCHNPICCNPEHLEVGTHKDNYHDSIDNHIAASNKNSKPVTICGFYFKSMGEAERATSVGRGALRNHTVDGVFNADSYLEACRLSTTKPSQFILDNMQNDT